MSWDFHMESEPCPHCGHIDAPEECEANYTYNVAAMFHEALKLRSIACLDGMTGEECLPILAKGIASMATNPDKYIAMNPPNGWGNFGGAMGLLIRLEEWCNMYPKYVMRVE